MNEMYNVFVLGNGESRKSLSIEGMKKHGIVYGCNAIYRDAIVDVLIASDLNMQHEIYSAGYAKDNMCWFPAFERLPADCAETILGIMQITGEQVVEENERGERQEVSIQGVMHEAVEARWKAIQEVHPGIDQEEVITLGGRAGIWVLWLDEKDSVIPMSDKYSHIESYSSGTQAVHIACTEEYTTDVYIVGFGFGHYDGVLDNIYKGTKNYQRKIRMLETREAMNIQWISEHYDNFVSFPEVNFHIVSDTPETLTPYGILDNVKLLGIKEFQDRFPGA